MSTTSRACVALSLTSILLLTTCWSIPDRTSTTYKWTGCVSHLDDCSQNCPNTAAADENCAYTDWAYCSTFFSKQCKCRCTKKLDLAPCMEVDVKASSSDGKYYLTEQVHNGKETYVRRTTSDPRFIYWQSNKWTVSQAVGTGGALATCSSALLKSCSSGIKVETCKSLWRKDGRCGGSNKADGFSSQTAICNAESAYPCCSKYGWCGKTSGHCECSSCINYAAVKQKCVLEQTTQTPDFCEITPLDLVDHEIGKQMLWNVAGVVLGKLPIVGDVFDVFFAVMDPLGPTTSQYTLADNIIKGVNKQVEALKECMDQSITNSKVELIDIKFKEIIREAQFCAKLHNKDKKDCVKQLFQTFYGRLATFETKANSYLEYEKLIPIYQSIYPLFMTTLAARLSYLKQANDGCNFNAVLDAGKEGMDTFKRWGGSWALDSLVDQLTPPAGFDVNSCQHETNMDQYYKIFTNKDFLYALQYFSRGKSCQSYKQYRRMDVFVKMTKATNHWCEFRLQGSWLCNSLTWSQKCDVIKREARIFVNTLKSRLTNEYRPQFYKKYVENVDKYRQSLNEISPMACSQPKSMFALKKEPVVEDAGTSVSEPQRDGQTQAAPQGWSGPAMLALVGTSVTLGVAACCGVVVCIRKKTRHATYEAISQIGDKKSESEERLAFFQIFFCILFELRWLKCICKGG